MVLCTEGNWSASAWAFPYGEVNTVRSLKYRSGNSLVLVPFTVNQWINFLGFFRLFSTRNLPVCLSRTLDLSTHSPFHLLTVMLIVHCFGFLSFPLCSFLVMVKAFQGWTHLRKVPAVLILFWGMVINCCIDGIPEHSLCLLFWLFCYAFAVQ